MNREWHYLEQAIEQLNPDYVLRCLRTLVPEYKQAHMTEANCNV